MYKTLYHIFILLLCIIISIPIKGQVTIESHQNEHKEYSEGSWPHIEQALLPQFNQENGKYGYIDQLGQWIIPAKYESAQQFSEGFGIVKDQGLWGVIDERGNWVFRPDDDINFPVISLMGVHNGLINAKNNQQPLNKCWGYITPYGEWKIPPQFHSAGLFYNGLAVVTTFVENDKKTGYISKEGKWVIPPVYDTARPFSEDLACVEKDGKFGYINTIGNVVIPLKFDGAGDLQNGYAIVWESGKSLARRSIGIIDKSGNWVIWPQPNVELIDLPYSGEYSLSGFGLNYPGSLSYGFMNFCGKWVLPPIYSQPIQFVDGLCIQSVNGGVTPLLYGYIDTAGKWVIPPIYSKVENFHKGVARVTKIEYKDITKMYKIEEGYIDRYGNWIYKNSSTVTSLWGN